jgi:hypothetical protein
LQFDVADRNNFTQQTGVVQHAVEAGNPFCDTVGHALAVFLRSMQQVEREVLGRVPTLLGNLLLNANQFAFGTAKQNNLRTEAGVGECGFTADTIACTGNQYNTLAKQVGFRMIMH